MRPVCVPMTQHSASDDALVADLTRGSEAALGLLYDRHAPAVYRSRPPPGPRSRRRRGDRPGDLPGPVEPRGAVRSRSRVPGGVAHRHRPQPGDRPTPQGRPPAARGVVLGRHRRRARSRCDRRLADGLGDARRPRVVRSCARRAGCRRRIPRRDRAGARPPERGGATGDRARLPRRALPVGDRRAAGLAPRHRQDALAAGTPPAARRVGDARRADGRRPRPARECRGRRHRTPGTGGPRPARPRPEIRSSRGCRRGFLRSDRTSPSTR